MLGEHDVAHQERELGPKGVGVYGGADVIGGEDFGCVEGPDYGV